MAAIRSTSCPQDCGSHQSAPARTATRTAYALILPGLLACSLASLPAGAARADVPCEQPGRVCLNGQWRFWTDPDTHVPITVPFSNPPRDALTAYQKLFDLPPGTCPGLTLLRFDGLVGQASIYLNGLPLGEHNSYTPFWFDVSEVIHRDSTNDLIVTIDDVYDLTTTPYDDIPWINYSGIHRNVYLECAEKLIITSVEPQYDLAPDYTSVAGQVTVRAAALPGTLASFVGFVLDGEPGNWTVVAAMTGTGPKLAGAERQVSDTLTFSFNNPQLWSPDAPRLYTLYVIAFVQDAPAVHKLLKTGFRDIRVDGNRILLNGQTLFLRGISRHDIYPGTGFVGSPQQMYEDLAAIKAAGANWVRLIHYPQHPYVLELADELGLLVSEELPAWAAFNDPLVQNKLFTMAGEMVRRDMHHPSVFLWVSGVARAHPTQYAAAAQQLFKSLDRNRLATYVIDNDQYDPNTIAVDVQLYHEADLDLYMKITWWFYYVEYLQDAWANFPKDIPIVIAEFGREGNDREPIVVEGENEFWWGEDQQADAIFEMCEAWRPHLPMYDAQEFISGLCLFNWQDTDWPDIERYLPNHIPKLCWGLVYDDRAPKRALQTITDFYTTLPGEFVGLPQPGDAIVEQRFLAPANLGAPLNTIHRDSGPSLSADGNVLFFASDGPDFIGRPKIFYSERLPDGGWSAPLLFNIPQETDPFAFRRAPCISYDMQTLYFTRAVVSGIYVAQTRIWQTTWDGQAWSEPQDLGDVINYPDAARSTSDPAILGDGRTLFFSSDRPGGFGRMDLWVSQRIDGEWTLPVNLGPTINTEYGESEPSLTADGQTLYFTSDRPGGMGSSDIWVSHLVNGVWTPPRNLGPGLNSPGGDREPEISKNGRFLIFTGIRSGGLGLSDLWMAPSICSIADADADGAVGENELSQLLGCLAGPDTPADPACEPADVDADGDVDAVDVALLQRCYAP